MKGNEQEMRLHKQVRQGQAALMRISQYGNHIDGTTLLAYTWGDKELVRFLIHSSKESPTQIHLNTGILEVIQLRIFGTWAQYSKLTVEPWFPNGFSRSKHPPEANTYIYTSTHRAW